MKPIFLHLILVVAPFVRIINNLTSFYKKILALQVQKLQYIGSTWQVQKLKLIGSFWHKKDTITVGDTRGGTAL